ncbi:MAG: hypothetical protein JST54_00730 [Deltaproteobacteria bacterium]|nr:hypothetical protein [Deltaproteobacteria bacterium]
MENAEGLVLFLAIMGAAFVYLEMTRKPDAPPSPAPVPATDEKKSN